MRHYTDEKWFEWAAFEGWADGKNQRIRKSLAEVKRGYRRRERAALKRETRALVESETSTVDRAHLERKLDKAAAEWETLTEHRRWLAEIGCFDENYQFIESAEGTASRRFEEAFNEWLHAA